MQPLLEPAVLVSENCPDCKGTGAAQGALVCPRCDGQAREIREVPLSEFYTMVESAHESMTAPPPSVVRERARRG